MTIRWLHGRLPDEPIALCGLEATIAILIAIFGLSYGLCAACETHSSESKFVAAETKSASKTAVAAARNDGYVGSSACARCHVDIYNHFVRTSMGHSMTPVTPEMLRTIPASASLVDAKTDHHFEVQNKDGKLYQSEFELDASGHEIFRNTHEIRWIVGANANGLGALVSHDDYLFEAPLSYYEMTGKWDLSPGYQRGDYGFNRVIAPGCIFCHSGRSQPVAGSEGKYQNPAFTQLAIGCENCHGPGAQHVDAMGEGDSYARGKDPTIVNPANLKPALANDICMSCHQTGDTRIFQPGKTYADFRPGQPLDRVMAILMVPPTPENPPSEDHVEHYYSMILSKCYRASLNNTPEKQMRCITCHDPHIQPTSAEAPAFFNAKCMSCHTAQSCKAPAPERHATSPADNCIGCHMQKRPGIAISHTSITNHRIVTRPGEAFPDAAFNMTTAQLPDLIHLDAVAGENTPPPAITLLQAYDQLKDQKPAYMAPYLKVLEELEASEASDSLKSAQNGSQDNAQDNAQNKALVQAASGHLALTAGKLDEAERHLRESIRLDPSQVKAYVDLSAVCDQKGEAENAVDMAKKAVILDPFSQPLQKTLIDRLITAKRYPEAIAAMESYLEKFPEDDFMRKMLAIAKEP